MLKEIQVRSVSSSDMAKYQGLMGAFIGLIVGVIYSAFFFLMGTVGQSSIYQGAKYNSDMMVTGDAAGIGAGLAFGLGIATIIIVPIFYAIIGFIAGYITTGIGNRILGFIGGVRATVFEKEEESIKQ